MINRLFGVSVNNRTVIVVSKRLGFFNLKLINTLTGCAFSSAFHERVADGPFSSRGKDIVFMVFPAL